MPGRIRDAAAGRLPRPPDHGRAGGLVV